MVVAQRADLTFKHNIGQGRHGWLRLTPAYSVKVVHEILDSMGQPQRVLDPFGGSGTTGLVCAEQAIPYDLIELNPFLVWLAQVKSYNYSLADLDMANELAYEVIEQARQNKPVADLWIPPLNYIDRWWSTTHLTVLANLFEGLQKQRILTGKSASTNLLLVAFCRVAISWSNAAFNHQSVSFKSPKASQLKLFEQDDAELILLNFLENLQQIADAARSPLPLKIRGSSHIYNGDARNVELLTNQHYDCVITSPPYPNRMSYIRELRPYMYWLGFLNEAREAGELDWEAIGGTWGVATSRLASWKPSGFSMQDTGLNKIIAAINVQSPLLANYVHKYFLDIGTHLANLRLVLRPGAKVFYVVGNSKFYDTLVPVEQIYAGLFEQYGYNNVRVELLRKRNSKKELYEYMVMAEWG